jgi:hypothetical protein
LRPKHLQALKVNAACPENQQLSEAELVLNSQLLQQLRGSVTAEEAQLLSEVPRKSRQQEVQAKRLKTLCWDALEVCACYWCTMLDEPPKLGLLASRTQVVDLTVSEDTEQHVHASCCFKHAAVSIAAHRSSAQSA